MSKPVPRPNAHRRRVCMALSALGTPVLFSACASGLRRPGAVSNTTRAIGPLWVDDGGSGSALPVLFVHAYGGSSAHWQAPLAHLRTQRRAIAFDLRAHGQSRPAVPAAYQVSDYARDIATLADALKLPRFVLVGLGLGAAAAGVYASLQPARVAGLMLVALPGRHSATGTAQFVEGLRNNPGPTMDAHWRGLLAGASPETTRRVLADAQRLPREVNLPSLASALSHDPVPTLQAYPGPKLMVDVAQSGGAEALFRQVPELPRRVIADSSHWPQLDQPEEFNTLLDEFLARVAPEAVTAPAAPATAPAAAPARAAAPPPTPSTPRTSPRR